jgi:hypothetical protein
MIHGSLDQPTLLKDIVQYRILADVSIKKIGVLFFLNTHQFTKPSSPNQGVE